MAREVRSSRCRCPATAKGRLCCGCLVCTVVIAIILLIAAVVIGKIGGNGITKLPDNTRTDATDDLDPTNVMRVTWLPGCGEGKKTDEELDQCGGSCFNSSLISRMESFYAENGFRMVNFSSRAGPRDGPNGQDAVKIKAWYIPPAPGVNVGPGTPPRVVVSHGTNQNQNKFESQIAGFLLAQAGFGVLLPSLRDHGYSGDSKLRTFAWGWEYPYDLLGAWDYAKNDPDGLLGGALPADQVGVMGFSMGGFTAVNAFGMERDIPAVWADAPVFSVREILLHELRKIVGPLGDLAIPFAWAFANQVVQLDFNTPARVLLGGPASQRQVYLVQNTLDTTVPEKQGKELIDFLQKYPDEYKSEAWYPAEECNGDTHRINHLKDPTGYQARLCAWWTQVFGLSQDRCAGLPAIF
mmetsp:Transcript_49314/g.127194  ORF Transcript_49314/g.127194 Transcript_49314/m.127194 type:complete len:410 (+) Transcript_49314:66-1295(+)